MGTLGVSSKMYALLYQPLTAHFKFLKCLIWKFLYLYLTALKFWWLIWWLQGKVNNDNETTISSWVFRFDCCLRLQVNGLCVYKWHLVRCIQITILSGTWKKKDRLTALSKTTGCSGKKSGLLLAMGELANWRRNSLL